MLIQKQATIDSIQQSVKRFEPHCNTKDDEGFLDGLRFAIRIVKLQEETEIGQVAFQWEPDCAWR